MSRFLVLTLLLLGLGGRLVQAQQTFSASFVTSAPTDDLIAAQPKASWDATHSTTTSVGVAWVGAIVINAGQTFKVRSAVTLRSLTLKLGDVRPGAAAHPYSITLFSYKGIDSVTPDSAIWTATGTVPESLYKEYKSDPENAYLTLVLPETKLESGVYGLVISATVDAGKDNWKNLISFTQTWGSSYAGGQLVTGRNAHPGDIASSTWAGSQNDLTFWLQGSL